MDFSPDPDHDLIAEAVDAVCARYDDAYWAERDANQVAKAERDGAQQQFLDRREVAYLATDEQPESACQAVGSSTCRAGARFDGTCWRQVETHPAAVIWRDLGPPVQVP